MKVQSGCPSSLVYEVETEYGTRWFATYEQAKALYDCAKEEGKAHYLARNDENGFVILEQ